MRALRFTTSLFLLFVSFALPLTAQAEDQSSRAAGFIQKLGTDVIGILADKSVTPQEANTRFRSMLHNNFDLNFLGKFALGSATWKSLTPQQQQDYMKLFESLVVGIYSERFRTYNGEQFKVGSAHPESATDSYVTSTIVKPDGSQPTEVDWRVRDKDGKFQVTDVIVEGVSMSVSKRSEFSSAIQQNNGDFNAFLELLRQKVNSGNPD